MSAAAVAVEGLRKTYPNGRHTVSAVENVSFQVEPGTFFTLLGPSGCGKTTTMRCIAGLEVIDGGRITIGERVVSALEPRVFIPPNRRDIGMVFQSYAIWPHMTVEQNVAFPLKAAGIGPSTAEARARIAEALALVRLEGYGARMATQLSGGQQQRLALARALVGRPQLLLLDEPLSNLDARLRDHMRGEVRALQQRLGITTIYVTHDQVEAMSMSDRIAVMQDGRIVQLGTPNEMYLRPVSPFVADFFGSSNVLVGTIPRAADAGDIVVETAIGPVVAASQARRAAGESVAVNVRPEHVRLVRSTAGEGSGRVLTLTFFGEVTECDVAVRDATLRVRAFSPVTFAVGDEVAIEVVPGTATVT